MRKKKNKKIKDPKLTNLLTNMLEDDDSDLGDMIRKALPYASSIFNSISNFKELVDKLKEDEESNKTISYPVVTPSTFFDNVNTLTSSVMSSPPALNAWNDLANEISDIINNVITKETSDNLNNATLNESEKDKESNNNLISPFSEIVEDISCLCVYHCRRIEKTFSGDHINKMKHKILKLGIVILENNGIENWQPVDLERIYGNKDDDEIEKSVNNSEYYHFFELIG